MNQRLLRLRQKLQEQELDAILISQAENWRYLSGFSGSAAYLLISQQDAILATDFRYVEQAERQAPDFQILQIKGSLADWFPQLSSELRMNRLGFESQALSFIGYRELSSSIEKLPTPNRPNLIPSRGLVESLRAIKDPEEMALIERAAALADAAVDQVAPKLEPGMTEIEAAWMLERYLRENGSEPLPFELIVASGPNSALPHAQPSERRIGTAEPVIMDIGARLGGYCSDLSRTICLGEPEQILTQIYQITLEAQLAAIEHIQSGSTGHQADRWARAVIEDAGYGDAFGHGLGHGIGLAAHEEPRLGPDSISLLSPGMVFTIEPGIYIKGWGGIRIEDMVVLEKGKARVLTRAQKELRRQDDR